jgi:hypothetical protein
MIFKSSSQLSPNVSVSIDNTPVDYLSLQRITVELKENMHDMVILDFAGLDPETMHLFIDSAVTLNISMPLEATNEYTFHGYVIYLEPFSSTKMGTANGSPFQLTRVFCLGPSYRMKGLKSSVHENKTLAEIATELAAKYKFSLSVPNDTYRFPRLVQSAESDWSFLVKASNRLGYNLMVTGSHIHIWDPYMSIARNSSYSVLYTIRGTKGDVRPLPGQILKFDGRIGNVSPDGARSTDTIHTLDSNGNILSVGNLNSQDTSSLGTPVQSAFTNVLNWNADSYETANKLVEGVLRRKFPMTASVDVVADPSITPGGIVNIKEYNAQFDGYWYVRGVRHELTQHVMATYLDLAKDSLDGIQTSPINMEPFKTPPETALIHGDWVSTKDMINVYS